MVDSHASDKPVPLLFAGDAAIKELSSLVENELDRNNFATALMFLDNADARLKKDALYAFIAQHWEYHFGQKNPNGQAYQAIIEHCKRHSNYFKKDKKR